MTKLLTEVIRQIVELPEERQDDAARALMLMLEHDPEQCGATIWVRWAAAIRMGCGGR